MKNMLFLLLFSIKLCAQKQEFVTTDVDHFWEAYDQIVEAIDSARQYRALQELYLDKATPGLKSLMLVRNYTPGQYIDAINRYPQFWKSIRNNTFSARHFFPEIESNIGKLQKAYPSLRRVPIYFSVGVFRTNGTVHEGKVLIGAETALADQKTVVDELPEWRRPFYGETDQSAALPLLCTHEYIHTQQKEFIENLLSMCLYEGIAEFISCTVTGTKSNVPAIEYGKANHEKVMTAFANDLYKLNHYNWLWAENRNELKVRDLGYYVGFVICQRYYESAPDKQKAVRELIELDYRDEPAVEKIVDASNALPKRVAQLYEEYEASRPTIVKVEPFDNGSPSVAPGLRSITVTFSEAMNGSNTGVDFGPLGESACPKLNANRVWSADRKSWTFEAELKPNTIYQFLISNNFRKTDGTRLKPYLIEFQTTN